MSDRERLRRDLAGVSYMYLHERSTPRLLELGRQLAELAAEIATELEKPVADDPDLLLSIANVLASTRTAKFTRTKRKYYVDDTQQLDEGIDGLRKLFNFTETDHVTD